MLQFLQAGVYEMAFFFGKVQSKVATATGDVNSQIRTSIYVIVSDSSELVENQNLVINVVTQYQQVDGEHKNESSQFTYSYDPDPAPVCFHKLFSKN